jgi:hypothetical protein
MRRHETEDSELGRMGGEEGTLIEDLICSYSPSNRGPEKLQQRDQA